MSSIKVAVPVDGVQGLDSPLSGHFGHCQAFVVSTIEDGKVVDVKTLENHGHTSCAAPVMLLVENGVKVLITTGIGRRPYMVTQQVGMSVVKGEGKTAGDAVGNYIKGTSTEFGQESLCGGGPARH